MSGVASAFTRASKCGAVFHCETVKLARKSSIKKTLAMITYGSRNDKKTSSGSRHDLVVASKLLGREGLGNAGGFEDDLPWCCRGNGLSVQSL